MTNWRKYRIANKINNSNYIRFELDDSVSYSGRSERRIDCKNHSPFDGWYAGDYIEIDNDKTRYKSSGYDFTSTTEVRLVNCHHHDECEDLKERYNTLERERNDLRTDRDSWRRKYDELKDKLNDEKIKSANEMANEKLSRQNTESTLRNEKRLVEEKLENFKTEKENFLKQIEDGKQELSLIRVEKDNQLALTEDKLTQKDDKLKELEKAMEILRINNEKLISEKESSLREVSSELRGKKQEIKTLQSERFQSQEELLIERINLEKDNLEVFVSELKIGLEEAHSLTKYYQRLLFARKERNRVVIEESEENIAKTKQVLLDSKISIENVRKISRECEKLAGLNWNLEQIQQQYEAKQEVPTK